jgi:hypothetical protein
LIVGIKSWVEFVLMMILICEFAGLSIYFVELAFWLETGLCADSF